MKQHTGSPERQEPVEYDFQATGYFDIPVQYGTGKENVAHQQEALQQPEPRPRKRSRRSLTAEEAASLAPLDEALQQSARKPTTKRRKRKDHEDGEEDSATTATPYPKPDVSFYVLIKEAILSSPEQRLLLCEIYDAIQSRYPYFKTAGDGWKNSIRHNLSIKRTFYKEIPEAKEPGGYVPKKGAYWRVAKESLAEDYAAEMKAAAIAAGGGGKRRGSTGSVNLVSPYASYMSMGLPTYGSLMSRPSPSAYPALPPGIRPALFPLRPPPPPLLPVPSLHDIGRRHSTRSFDGNVAGQQPFFPRITPNRPKPAFLAEPRIAEGSESVYTKIEPLPLETEVSVEMGSGNGNWPKSTASPKMDLYIDWTGEGKETPKTADSSEIPVVGSALPAVTADMPTTTRTPSPMPPPDLEKGETYEGPTKHRQNIKEVWFGAPNTLQENDL